MKEYPDNWACCADGATRCSYCGTIHCAHQCCEPKWEQLYSKKDDGD